MVSVVAGITEGMASLVGGRRHSGLDVISPFHVGIVGLGSIGSLLASSFIGAGIVNFSLKVARGAPYAFGDLFSGGPFFGPMLVANLVQTIAVGIGFTCFVVPGVIIGLGLSMTFPLIVDRNLGPIEALQESWKLTDGQKMNLFVYSLMGAGLAIAGACVCGIGLFLVVPIMCIAHMYIYLKLTRQPVADITQAQPRPAGY